MKAIERHVQAKWAKIYITRWIEAPIEDRRGNTTDDIIVHCSSQAEAEEVLRAIRKRLGGMQFAAE